MNACPKMTLISSIWIPFIQLDRTRLEEYYNIWKFQMLHVVFLSAIYNEWRHCTSTAFFQSILLWFEFKEKISQQLLTDKMLEVLVFGSQGWMNDLPRSSLKAVWMGAVMTFLKLVIICFIYLFSLVTNCTLDVFTLLVRALFQPPPMPHLKAFSVQDHVVCACFLSLFYFLLNHISPEK